MAVFNPSEAPDPNAEKVVIPLRAVAVASSVVSLACIAVLITIVSLKHVDALATVALALAVITFVAQLIVLVIQTTASQRASLSNTQLVETTLSALSEIKALATGTQTADTQIDEPLIGGASGVTRRESTSARAAAARRAADVSTAPMSETPSSNGQENSPSSMDDEIRAFMTRPPTKEEAPELLGELEALTLLEQWLLFNASRNELECRQPGSPLAPGIARSVLDEGLVDRGLMEVVQDASEDRVRLTALGRSVGCLLTFDGPLPPDLYGLEPIRHAVQEEDEALSDRP